MPNLDTPGLTRLLFAKWDPIGVRGVGPDDEYASYAPVILKMLQDGASGEMLFAHLRDIRVTEMCLPADDAADRAFAAHLIGLLGS
ncbi:hypothetical protein HDIA_4510 [Hartmannibacter diazotrophicus]|uniref:DUF1871 domain-containing protein n=1 Tax=Hartmannibacter diazotrophicus TaxID=1482074 RepID=A0A2C9DE38_9HYPH|nr:hypothetical protein [Hartmannibacter diazotrophicus]SON58051.1 hypothetical protein HDIA_4510 [Hartmannibacter diazotrophicus]